MEDKVSPPGEGWDTGTLTQHRKGESRQVDSAWDAKELVLNPLGKGVSEFQIRSNTVGFTWSTRERLSHVETSVSL